MRTGFSAAVLLVATTAVAADWPQFRGPDGSGVVTGKTLPPDRWTTTENVAWKYEVPGHGWSCPVVAGGRVFLTSCVSDTKFPTAKTGYYAPRDTKTSTGEHRWTAFCLDAATGKVLWERVAHKGAPQHPIHVKASYAPETPVTDGERVYAYFGNVGLYCFDKDGKELWSKSWGVFPTRIGWGTGASPILHGDRVYIVNDNEKSSFLVALDKRTGKEVWKVERDEKSNWATPFLWDSGKRTELVTVGTNKVRSYDLDGKLLWQLGGMSSICVPMPVAGHGLLFISSGYEFGRPRPVFAVRPGASGDISLKKDQTSSEFIAWHREPAGAYHPTPLVLGDHLYVLYSTGFLSCFDAKTGKPVYERERLEGSFTASPWAYDDKVFCLSEEGTTYVVKAGAKFELLGKNVLGEVALATPAVADGRLFLRTVSTLYCIHKPTNAAAGEQGASAGHETRQICGWTVHVNRKLLEVDATVRALKLLQKQCEEILQVVPKAAVAEMQKVPLWISPEYPKIPPRAEYHPDPGWLRRHGRDPAMAKAVEFTNVRIFEAETRRMPNFVLHELAHAYHDRVLGFQEPRIRAAYEKARASGKYDRVERRDSEGRVRTDRAYALTNEKEYFAETTEAFFSRNDFYPFTREQLEMHDPEMVQVLKQVWKIEEPGSEVGKP